MDNKRSTDRVSFKGRVHINDEAGRPVSTTARLKDVSASGFSLITEDPVKMGLHYRFKIFLNIEETIELRGRVLHVKRESVYTMAGVTLDPVPLSNRSRLNRFLSSQSKTVRLRFLTYSLVAGVAAGLLMKLVGAPLAGQITGGLALLLMTHVWQPW